MSVCVSTAAFVPPWMMLAMSVGPQNSRLKCASWDCSDWKEAEMRKEAEVRREAEEVKKEAEEVRKEAEEVRKEAEVRRP